MNTSSSTSSGCTVPYEAWLDQPTVSTSSSEPVARHWTALDMPRVDMKLQKASTTLQRIRSAGLDAPLWPDADREEEIIYREMRTWTASLPEDDLMAEFSGWDKAKQESFIKAMAAFQVHSFAIEGVPLSEQAVLESTEQLLCGEAVEAC